MGSANRRLKMWMQ